MGQRPAEMELCEMWQYPQVMGRQLLRNVQTGAGVQVMTAEQLEKLYTVRHYRDLAGQAQIERRTAERRKATDGPPVRDRRVPVCGCGNALVAVPGHGSVCPLAMRQS